jgi:two-component system chemotaxis response regulator CheB
VVIGASWGGLAAVSTLLSGLDRSFTWPIALVLHRDQSPGDILCEILRSRSPLPVEEPDDHCDIGHGRVYLGPPGYHLLAGESVFHLSAEEPYMFCRPSIDYLFFSAAESVGSRAIGILLTGANRDGADGLARIKSAGGLTLVQAPSTAACATMPQAGLLADPTALVLSLEGIARTLLELHLASKQEE